jgi:hypothetical protein
MIHFNIIHTHTSGLPSGLFPSGFPISILQIFISPHSCYIYCPSHHPWLGYSSYTLWKVKVMKLLIMQFLQSPVTSPLFGPNILKTLFSNTVSPYSSLNIACQVSHPYRATDKIAVLCALIFIHLKGF